MNYQVCSRCVMDNHSDDTITFDESGYCNYCTNALSRIAKTYLPNEDGTQKLKEMINKLKEEGKEKRYDCLMGISGGLDSSYLVYLGAKWGLRILLVHIDDGHDTDITKENLEKLSIASNIEIITIRPDQEQYNDLIRSFIRAGVPNIAIPQDNILFAYLYKCAREYGIKYFLSGGNFALESILQKGNTHNAYDLVNIKDIHKRFGTKPMDKLSFISEQQKDIDKYIYKIQSPRPLNYIDYNRERALRELNEFCGFTYYGSKHLENSLTKFIQVYYLPKKFKVDKRKSHLSSMIVSGQMTRKQALQELDKPLYNEIEMQKEIAEILISLDITRNELDDLMGQKPKQHNVYKVSKYDQAKNVVRGMQNK